MTEELLKYLVILLFKTTAIKSSIRHIAHFDLDSFLVSVECLKKQQTQRKTYRSG